MLEESRVLTTITHSVVSPTDFRVCPCTALYWFCSASQAEAKYG